ncbi:hypothetical protein VTH06DRAFT_3192 [Thermothelomyces fergusii]
MGPSMDISALVEQMQETLAHIHTTFNSLDPDVHERKLDDLEKQRNDALEALSAAFAAESDSLDRRRQARREEIRVRREREDAERERRRRQEDEELAAKDGEEDRARSARFREERDKLERELGDSMARAEEEARAAVEQGREKLRMLQERKRELDRRIEEELEKTLPMLPLTATRRGRATRNAGSPPRYSRDESEPPVDTDIVQPSSPEEPTQQETSRDEQVVEDTRHSSPATREESAQDGESQRQYDISHSKPGSNTIAEPSHEPTGVPDKLDGQEDTGAATSRKASRELDGQDMGMEREAPHPPVPTGSPGSPTTAGSKVEEMASSTGLPGQTTAEAGEDLGSPDLGSARNADGSGGGDMGEEAHDIDADLPSTLSRGGTASPRSSVAEHETVLAEDGSRPSVGMSTEAHEDQGKHGSQNDLGDADAWGIGNTEDTYDVEQHASEDKGPDPLTSAAASASASVGLGNPVYCDPDSTVSPPPQPLEKQESEDEHEMPGSPSIPARDDTGEDLVGDGNVQDRACEPEDEMSKENEVATAEHSHSAAEKGDDDPIHDAIHPTLEEAGATDAGVDDDLARGGQLSAQPTPEHSPALNANANEREGGNQPEETRDIGQDIVKEPQVSGQTDELSEDRPSYDAARADEEVPPSKLEPPVAHSDHGPFAEHDDVSREEPETDKAQEERIREALHAAGYDEPKCEDADAASQRFVTSLPSHPFPGAAGQPWSDYNGGVNVDDDLGEIYHGDGARQHELEHQHSTTVHGEDELFDDTDRSEENHASLENAVIEHLGIDPQGARALRRSLGHLEHLGQSAEARPDVSDEQKALGDDPMDSSAFRQESAGGQQSWTEEDQNSYCLAQADTGAAETSSQQVPGIPHAPAANDTSQGGTLPTPTLRSAGVGGFLPSEGQNRPERPQTPIGYEPSLGSSSEYVTPEALGMGRLSKNVAPWGPTDDWTPQSLRTHTTSSSPPHSPSHGRPSKDERAAISQAYHNKEQRQSLPEHESTPYRENDHGGGGGGGGEEQTEDNTPAALLSLWQHRASPDLTLDPLPISPQHQHHHQRGGSGSGSGSGTGTGTGTETGAGTGTGGGLFRRVRSIFEQPRHHLHDSSGTGAGTRPRFSPLASPTAAAGPPPPLPLPPLPPPHGRLSSRSGNRSNRRSEENDSRSGPPREAEGKNEEENQAGGRRGGGGGGRKEAVGDARLAWAWVEGWRARLRRGADVVERAKGETETAAVSAVSGMICGG